MTTPRPLHHDPRIRPGGRFLPTNDPAQPDRPPDPCVIARVTDSDVTYRFGAGSATITVDRRHFPHRVARWLDPTPPDNPPDTSDPWR